MSIADKEFKEELVQQITGQPNKRSCKDLSFEQANQLLSKLGIAPQSSPGKYWGTFSMKNPQHKYILSLLRQIGWTKTSDRYGLVADMERLGNFLQSEKSPVQKPLRQMSKPETTKLINCLESMLGKKFAKP